MSSFEKSITATKADIDELGHVNNAVWVQWIQDVAVSHWYALAPADYADRYIWVVTRHEIDYLRAVLPGGDQGDPGVRVGLRPETAPPSPAGRARGAPSPCR